MSSTPRMRAGSVWICLWARVRYRLVPFVY